MSYVTLIPAYGRDYKSQAAVKADLAADKDFIWYHSPWDGKPVNLSQLREERIGSVNVRYGNLRKVVVVDLRTL